MYLDLYCSNLYNLIEYTSLIQNFLSFKILKKYNEYQGLLLNESIIQHMLAVILKSNLNAFLTPLWHMYMFAIYLKNQKSTYNLFITSHLSNIIDYLISFLLSFTTLDCRKNNTYDSTSTQLYNLNETVKIPMIKKVMNVMAKRNITNNVLMHGEKVDNWVSLKKIYLCEIVENINILKTIIMGFGDQNETICNKIFKDIRDAYDDARNYYWFDLWILKIRTYHEKILNILKVVILHFIRKHLKYLMFNDDKIVEQCNIEIRNHLHDITNKFGIMLCRFSEFENIKKSLVNLPNDINKTYNIINSEIITNIENAIRAKFDAESFEILRIDVNNEKYNMKSITKTEELMACVQISEIINEKITRFNEISQIQGLNDNFLRFNIFVQYFENIFKSKLKVFKSFMCFSVHFNITFDHETEQEKKKRLLDLEVY
ncbi:uncharacterized protein LOC126893528 [Daktulosphaira vitifoliae]|uniref:uncharacterized protein LOC126893528 n=1 Tax=Daktulosphaira vitifoliae TaxID=58002 RepID=UPI0021AB0350|nr:uncharacterized protein LOC126893528 [Daktulosphaira vitifoliae]